MNKRRLATLLALILLLTLAPTAWAEPETEVLPEPQPVSFTILHTNDVHSRVAEQDGTSASADTSVIGLAKVAALKSALIAEGKNVLLLDAGDALHGKPFANLFNGESIVAAMNAAGYDVMAPGNHDFNYGYKHLAELAKQMKFPLVSANVTKSGKTLFAPYVIKEFDGVKIGIFGLSTPETIYKTSPTNVKGIKFGSPVTAAARTVKALKAAGCSYIVALTHLGDSSQAKDSADLVASKTPGIDLIVDGHSHTVLNGGKKVGGALIVQTGEYCQYVGRVDVTVTGAQKETAAKLLAKDDLKAYKDQAETAGVIGGYITQTKDLTKEVIGKTEVDLVGERALARTGMTNLGALVADVFRKQTGADVALTNGGGIRASIKTGDVTIGNVLTVFPFNNRIIVVALKGKDIKAALEHGVSLLPDQNGGFPHVSGLTCSVDASKPAGSRVSNIRIGGRAIGLNKTYTLATNDFMAIGGDGYTMLARPNKGDYGAMEELIIKHIKENGVTIPADWDKRIVITLPAEQAEDEAA